MPGGRDTVGGGVRAAGDRRGNLLPRAAEGTGEVQGVQVGDGGRIIGGEQDDTEWASGRGEIELENLGHGGRSADVLHGLPGQGMPAKSFPVEGCPRRVMMRTAVRVHFIHLHVLYTVVILEEGNIPHPRCPQCDMMFPCHKAPCHRTVR